MKCQICGTENPETAKFCNECGAKIERKEENRIVCSGCGKDFSDNFAFCPFCGKKVEENPEENTRNVDEEVVIEKYGSISPEQTETENPDVSNFDEETLLCPSCKAEINQKNKFCPVCGVNIAEKHKELEELKAIKETIAEFKFEDEVEIQKCVKCGAEISSNVKFCPICGSKQETKIFCEGCGAELLSNVKFCPSCGTPRNGNVQQKVSIVEPVTQTDSISVPLDNDEKKDAMLEAIKKDNIKAVEAILNSGYKVNKRILDVTPLGLAAIFDSTNVAKFLIQRGAPVKGIASNCNTIPHHNPLMLAALNNSLKVAEVLIEAGADVNSANDNGRTAMKIAEARNHTEMMDLLQKNGAKVTSVRSVLQKGLSVAAVLSGNPGLVIQAGAKDADIDNLYLRDNY